MSTSQLTLYNGALRVLGQPKLASLAESVENRRVLDSVWDENARDFALEQGNWNFAIRTVKIEYNSSIDPDFGHTRGFDKPSDWIRTVQLSADEFFTAPMVNSDFSDEQSYIFASIDTIYMRFVSSDDSYGYDLSLWPQSFVRYFEHYMAAEIAGTVFNDQAVVQKFVDNRDDFLTKAKSKDALNEGIKFPPETGWVRARRSRLSRRSDLGSRSRLTG